MKKVFIILLMIFGLPVFGASLTGGVEYNVNDARIELQNNIPNSSFLLKAQDFDPNYEQNKSFLLKGETKLKDRIIGRFSDESYGVNYYNDPKHVWYYDKDGFLINAEVKTSLNYPYRAYKYDIDGQLVNMSMRVSEDETYIFSPVGKLLGHWVGENCYDESGNTIMKRKIMK